MSYSPDGEWLAGGAADQATHKIYIWDLSNDGQFASALEGGREPLIDMHVGGDDSIDLKFNVYVFFFLQKSGIPRNLHYCQ